MVILPLVLFFILMKMKIVSDIDVTDRNERHSPYLASMVTLLLGTIWLNGSGYEGYAKIFYFATLVNLILLYFINIFWKMSAHAMSAACMTAAAYITSPVIFILSAVLLTAIGWSRIHLGKHTFLQVLAGALSGFIITLILFKTAG